MYVADAVVVDKLVKALSAQTQLETVEVELAGLPNSDGIQVPIDFDFDSDEHLAPYYALEADTEDYKLTSGITARMFHPAWLSLCRFVEGSNMFRLRCDTARGYACSLGKSMSCRGLAYASRAVKYACVNGYVQCCTALPVCSKQ